MGTTGGGLRGWREERVEKESKYNFTRYIGKTVLRKYLESGENTTMKARFEWGKIMKMLRKECEGIKYSQP